MTIGLKFLRADGSSIGDTYGRVKYPLDGSWIDVPGNGAYVAMTDGLNSGGVGDIIVAMECETPILSVETPRGVTCYRRVRIVKHLDGELSRRLWTDYSAKLKPLDDDYYAKRKPLSDDYNAKRKLLGDDYNAKLKPLGDDYSAKRELLRDDYYAKVKLLFKILIDTVMMEGGE